MAKRTGELIRVNNARHMVVTQVCRLSFPVLFTPKAMEDKPNEPKYFRAHLIFDSMEDLKKAWNGTKTQTPSLLKAIRNAKEDQWGPKEQWPRFPYPNVLQGDDERNSDGQVRSGYEGKVFVKVKSGEKFAPKVVLANGSPASERDVYGGCFVQAQILVRPYVTPSMGISLRLLGVRKVKDGDKFGAGVDLFEYDETEEDGEDWETGDADDDEEDF